MLLDKIGSYWDTRAAGYSATIQKQLENGEAAVFRALLREGAPRGETLKCLDIGCGPGFFSILLAKAGCRVVGVDGSAGMLRHASQNAAGQGVFSCCGVTLPPLEPEKPDDEHEILIEKIDGEHYVHVRHPMEREHFICFFAYVTTDRVELVRLYPEMEAETRFRMSGPGRLYACCNRHGLFEVKIG